MPASPVRHVRCAGGGFVHQFLPHGALRRLYGKAFLTADYGRGGICPDGEGEGRNRTADWEKNLRADLPR